MSKNELTRFFVIFTLISSITLGFSACARMGKPTGGAGPVSMQQQQQQQEQQQQQQQEMFGNDMAGQFGNKMDKEKEKVKKETMKKEKKAKKEHKFENTMK